MEGAQILGGGVTISWHDIDCMRYESRRQSYFRREDTSLRGREDGGGQKGRDKLEE